MEKIVKLGVVGLDRGRHIVDSVIGEKNVCLRAICDKNEKRLADAKKHFEVEREVKELLCFDSFEELLKSDIDAVVIATEATIHTPMVVQALEAGKHVLSEIPTINTLEDATTLKKATNAHPELKYMAGENCCFWSFVDAWKKIYDKGLLGEVVLAEGEYLHHHYNSTGLMFDSEGKPTWRASYDAIKYITHELGPILYMLDDRCVSVCGFAPDFNTVPGHMGTPNEMAVFKTAKGAMIKIFIGFGVHVGFDHNFSLYGSKGTLETDRNKMLLEAHTFARFADLSNADEKIEIPVNLRYPGESDDGHGGADTQMMKAFIKSIVEDTKPPLDVDMGIRMSIPGIYAHESAKKGGIPIEIPDLQG